MAKPSELAILTVNGQLYQDWETVMVHHTKQIAPFFHFRFTCSEGMPLAKNWGTLQIRPGDWCEITLAGQPAFSGMVSTRQVYYDARRHHIEIQGASQVIALSHASVVHKTMEHNKVTYEQYARSLLKPFPQIQFRVEGGQLPQMKFPRIALPPGISVLEALEIPLRSVGNIDLTSNVKGDLVAIVGSNGDIDTVTEGVDILEGREIIYSPGYASGNASEGQLPGGDATGPDAAAHSAYHGKKNDQTTSGGLPSPVVIPLELPAFNKNMLQNRVNADVAWQTADQITVNVTVQGWLKRNGKLWDRNQQVRVVSPMLIMDGSIELYMKSVTFMQDNQRGSRTVLELVNIAAQQAIPQGPG